jgi:hypothetical protein
VIFSRSLEDHLEHLDRFFHRVYDMNMSLAPKKAFVGYPTVKLLGQRVDAFGVASTSERIAGLKNLRFPREGYGEIPGSHQSPQRQNTVPGADFGTAYDLKDRIDATYP